MKSERPVFSVLENIFTQVFPFVRCMRVIINSSELEQLEMLEIMDNFLDNYVKSRMSPNWRGDINTAKRAQIPLLHKQLR